MRKDTDIHLNVFWPYGPHAYWENNLTAAIARFLFYSSPGTRRRFVAECLNVGYAVDSGDYEVVLQPRDLPDDHKQVLKKSRRHVLIVRPSRLSGIGEDEEDLQGSGHQTPDLWLLNRGLGSLIVIEVKLWKSANSKAKSQKRAYEKKFSCASLKDVLLEDVYAWLQKRKARKDSVEHFLQQSLLEYLEDLSCAPDQAPRDRHLKTADCLFVNRVLARRAADGFVLGEMNKRLDGLARFSEGGGFTNYGDYENYYIAGDFFDDRVLGDIEFGFHTDDDGDGGSVCCISFIRGRAMDRVAGQLTGSVKPRVPLDWGAALEGVGKGFRIEVKISPCAHRSIHKKDSDWPYVYSAAGKGRWVLNPDNSNKEFQSADDMLRDLGKQIGKYHKIEMPKSKAKKIKTTSKKPLKWIVVLVLRFGDDEVRFGDLTRRRKGAADVLARQVRRAYDFHRRLLGESPRAKA